MYISILIMVILDLKERFCNILKKINEDFIKSSNFKNDLYNFTILKWVIVIYLKKNKKTSDVIKGLVVWGGTTSINMIKKNPP